VADAPVYAVTTVYAGQRRMLVAIPVESTLASMLRFNDDGSRAQARSWL